MAWGDVQDAIRSGISTLDEDDIMGNGEPIMDSPGVPGGMGGGPSQLGFHGWNKNEPWGDEEDQGLDLGFKAVDWDELERGYLERLDTRQDSWGKLAGTEGLPEKGSRFYEQDLTPSEKFGTMEHRMNVLDYNNPAIVSNALKHGMLSSTPYTDWTSWRAGQQDRIARREHSKTLGMQYNETPDRIVEINPAHYAYSNPYEGYQDKNLFGKWTTDATAFGKTADPRYSPNLWGHEYRHAAFDDYRDIDPLGHGNLNRELRSALGLEDYEGSVEEALNRMLDVQTGGGAAVRAKSRLNRIKADNPNFDPSWDTELQGIWDKINEALGDY